MKFSLSHTLAQLLETEGIALCQDRRRLRAFLEDYHPEQKKETNLLVLAAQEQVSEQLLDASDVVWTFVFYRCVQRLCTNWGIDRTNAEWAVETWAEALERFSAVTK